ncbi:MAG: sugar transferase [Gammaproteobacteria bacterium]|jgi:lipopolysaccharide/colanic/teichoic acid biosynthesis glycosyltransferase|nr:sugar transferase [Gammaproteobacteria bacterium]
MWTKFIKPVFDRLFSLVLLILLSPILLVVFILIRVFLGKPAVFKQPRAGFHGRVFMLYKFRTMTDAKGVDGKLLPDKDRLTDFGKFLRATSLDELPQLFNILKGDMSFVGPRPLLAEYLPLYNEEQARRHQVKPGITGWAQVNGRNAISWEEKFKLDCWYVDHQSFTIDSKIFWLTLLKVIRKEGVNQQGQATMEKFNGSN